jgi:methionyl-tRNA synthetase
MKEKIYIGVAWPYANGSLHLGHIAGCYLPADIFARFCRMKGKDVLMVSGSDEHGTPITITAEKEKKNPQEIVNEFNKEHNENMKDIGISFNLFTRTSTKNHSDVVQDIFLTLYNNGDIYKKSLDSFYCNTCKRYLPDRYIEGICPNCNNKARGDQCDECGKLLDPQELIDVKCKLCGGIPKIRKTDHLFFALTNYEKDLKNWLSDKKYWKSNVLKFTQNWLKSGLKDRAITRDIKWGVKVPIKGFEDKRIYVWFDAVIGYLSASIEWSNNIGLPDKWIEWWKNKNAKHYYFLAKDNIPFHTLIWPSIIIGYNKSLNLPYDIPANEYLRLQGEQFSKSRGTAIWIPEILKKFDADSIRYYLSINMPENKDSDWVWDNFISKNNDELVSTYGNFVHRVLTFTFKNFGKIPHMKSLDNLDKEALEKIILTSEGISHNIEKCHFKKGLREAMNLAQYGNYYFDQKKPWNIIKSDKEKCGSSLHICLKIVKALSIFTAPYLPFSSEKIWSFLGESGSIHEKDWKEAFKDLKVEHILEKPKPLFKKIELSKNMPESDPFSKMDLRVARILDVKDHPKADKLYLLQIDLGDLGKRIIIAGIKPFYKKTEIKHKTIVVVANLKSVKIRGITSRGMLLAAEDNEGTCSILNPGNSNPGSKIYIEGIKTDPVDILEFDEFKRVEMIVGDKQTISYKDKVLKSEKGNIYSDKKIKKGAKVL